MSWASDLRPHPGRACRQAQRCPQIVELSRQEQLLPQRCPQSQQRSDPLDIAGVIEAPICRLHQWQAAFRLTGQTRRVCRFLRHHAGSMSPCPAPGTRGHSSSTSSSIWSCSE